MEEIECLISPDGKVTLHVQGVLGEACLDLTRALEQGLGLIESRELKPEAYLNQSEVQPNWNAQGRWESGR
ncbi:MAG: DUF2997 domain-containing protein [Candidatus Sericytochromatia bacterium]|nr:DUF2997 domain-containing protein [Candidatus Sericytochromatia bacterium]